MQISNRFFVNSTIALLVVGFAALFGIVWMTVWLGDRAQVYFEDVIEARDTRGVAVELRNAVQTAESSQRGFLVTGNEIYLAPYRTAKLLAQRQLDALKRILASHSNMDVALGRLAIIISEKITEMDRTIELKRDRRDADALAIIRTNRGKALMDEANVFFTGVIRAADDRLTKGVSEQKANAATLRLVSIIGGIVIVIVVGVVFITVRRYTRELAAARDEVGALNASLEQRVKDRTNDLQQANDEIQRFAYIVTHDLRAPLVNIMGFTSELESSIASLQALIDQSNLHIDPSDPVSKKARLAATEDVPEAIGFIRSSTKKMDNLISAILKISREGQRTLRPERVDLGAVVKSSAAALQHQIAEASGEVALSLEVKGVYADKLSLEHIIGNLLDNAVKYRAEHRPLRIEVRSRPEPGNRISIEVADNGRGVAEQDRERIFEMFRRTGVQNQPGEGMGLAHVRAVVRKLGGEITVVSALDKGATFRVVLPNNP